MLRFRTLTIENFLSHQQSSVDFYDGDLTLILGENHDSPHSISNGSGKSAIFEALFWCIFGKTTRGTRGGEVVSRNLDKGEFCSVAATFNYLGVSYKIIRGRASNKPFFNVYTLDDVGEADEEIYDYVFPVTSELFLASVYFPQEKLDVFATSSDTHRKKLLVEIHALQKFDTYQTTAKRLHAKILDLIRNNEQERARLEGKIGVMEEQLSSDKLLMVTSLEGAQRDYDGIKRTIMARRMEISARKPQVELAISNLSIDLNEDGRERLRTRYDSYLATTARLQDTIDRAEEDLNQLEAVCPTCKQEITPEYVEKLKEELPYRELEDRQTKQKNISGSLAKREAQYFEIKELLDEKEEELEIMIRAMTATKAELSNEGRAFVKIVDNIKAAEGRISELQSQLVAAHGEMDEIIKEDEDLLRRCKYINFWVENFGMKGLVSFLLDQSIPALNDIAKVRLSFLCPDLELSFDTRRTKKDGNMAENFSVYIDGDDRRYTTLSGGEKRRIDLAILLSLATYARQFFPINILFLDEILTGLDAVGCDGVLELLQYERDDSEMSIFVVSHQDEIQESEIWDNILVVKKKDGKSYIEVEK